MHTFSPAKMWVNGLNQLAKPLAHLHTQFNRELPWSEIDMGFMNLNQSAHGDREYGFILARLRLDRKIVVGHWQDSAVIAELDAWSRVACAVAESRKLKIVRFGGMNMREVAVTGGDRLEAQIQLGWSTNGYGVGDLVGRIAEVRDAEVDHLVEEYEAKYTVVPELRRGGARRESLRYAARQEIGIRAFLTDGGYGAFTTTFEDLHGLNQLPGLACQRLMADGYGFGAEGDWKAAGLVRLMKVIAAGRKGGVSFMEDYTYHLVKGQETILGAHMLEICPSIADGAGQALAGDSPAVHRRQGRPLPAGLQRGAGTVGRRVDHRHGRADADGRAGDGRRQSRARHAEASGGARALRAAAGLSARLSGLAAGGRRAPHLVQPGGHRRADVRPGGHAGHRVRAHRKRHRSRRAQERAPLERRRLSAGPLGCRNEEMKSIYDELKEQAWQANMEIPRRGLAIYTFGNVSAFDAGRAVFAIKPSGVAYESLTAADMVVVDLDAKVVEGTCGPPPTRRRTPRCTRPSRESAGSSTPIRPTPRPGRRRACRSRSTARRTRTTSRRMFPARRS